jgi:hypothetical protein
MRTPAARQFEDPAAGAAQFMTRLGLVVLVVGLPIAAVWSRRLPFTLLPIGVGIILAGAFLAPDRRLWRPLQNGLLSPVGAAALTLVVWCGLAVAWTPFPELGLERYLKTVGTIAGAVLAIAALPPRVRTSNLYLLPIGVAGAALAAAITSVVTGDVFRVNDDPDWNAIDRAALAAAVFAWPAVGALAVRERWASAAVLAAGVVVSAVVIGSELALGALACGAVVFAAAWARPRGAATALAFVAGALILGAPALAFIIDRLDPLTGGTLPFGAAATAWVDVMTENPARALTGYGFDAAVRGFATRWLPAAAPRGAVFATWFDLGLIGALAAAVLAVRALRAAADLPPPQGAFMLAGLATVVAIAVAGGVALQIWWLNFLCVVAVGYAIMMRGQYRTARPPAQQAAQGDRQLERPVPPQPAGPAAPAAPTAPLAPRAATRPTV